MKNIFEIMKEYGLEVPEDKKKEFEAAVLENYKTISDYNNQKTALDTANEKLKAAEETMGGLNGKLAEYKDVDVSGLKQQIDDLTEDLKKKDEEHQKQLADRDFEDLLKDSISQARAAGNYSHAEGSNTQAVGECSHAEGSNTQAVGECSHAEGDNTVAGGQAQHVSGKYNEYDSGQYATIVGGGTSSERKNINTLDWAGNGWFAGDVTNGAGVSLNSLKSAVDNIGVIAGGASIAKVFDTKEDLDVWLAVEGNSDTLSVSQNIYIKETGTPGYWWDGTGLQPLETDKVVIESMTYDETMAVLNATEEVA